MPYFEGAEGTTLNNPILWDIAGSATFNEFKVLFVNHFAGMTSIPDFRDSLRKHSLHDSISALPRAKATYNDYMPSDKRRVMCLKGTREALLREVAEWITDMDQPGIYVLFGPAGFGKSTIAQTIAERADQLLILGASFFFSRDEVKSRTAERFFTTIVFQLCGYDKEFARAIGTTLQTERGSAATSKTPLEQLNVLILDPLKDIAKVDSHSIVIVIDALDECDDGDAWALLEALDRLVRKAPSFKVFLTARPHPHLSTLSDNTNWGKHKIFHLQSIEDKVDMYLPKLRKPWSASEQDIQSLVQAAGRLFIIASTAVRFILDKIEYNPVSQMNILRTRSRLSLDGLEGFYIVILRRAVPLKTNLKVVERFQIVIGTILCLSKPLPTKILEYFTFPWSSDDIDAVLKNLQSVIMIENDTPRVYHKSFSDFLIDTDRCQDDNLRIVPSDQHTRLAMRCLQTMNERLKRNILDLSGPIQYMDNSDVLEIRKELKGQLQEKIPPELRYACTCWVHHLVNGNDRDAGIIGELERFSNDHLLHWFEALSWTDTLDLAHRDLIALLKFTKSPSLRELFFDGLRFISRFYETVQKSALHVYHSALLFAPTESPLYKKSGSDVGLCKLFGGPARWRGTVATSRQDANLGTLRYIMFSKDGSQFATFRAGSVRLWDATSGTPLRSFKGDRHTASADFSRVAISQDNDVTLHNAVNGVQGAIFKHSVKVVELALSFDGARLAVGLSDRSVRVWDGGRSDHVAVFDSYSDAHHQLEFSPSNYTLAFASADGTIHLWDGGNGEFIGSVGYQLEKQSKFMFSHDGSRLTSIVRTEEGPCLALWSGRNELIGMVRVHGSALFAISPDGSVLATAVMDKVQLWSGRNGNPLPIIDTLHPSMTILSLALSRDVLAVGSAYSYGTIRLYDLPSRASAGIVRLSHLVGSVALSPERNRLAAGNRYHGQLALLDVQAIMSSASSSKHRSGRITSLSISPDCLRLAAGVKNGTVELWDIARTGKRLAAHRDHAEDVSILAFCPTGERFASGSQDTTVILWNGRDGTPIDSLRRPFRFLTSLAFSHNLLAIAAVDGVTLWDCETFDCLHSFEHSSHQLSLSPDSSLLASASKTYGGSEVELWSVGNHTRVETLQFDQDVARVMFSPDGSQLAVQLNTGILELFKFVDNQAIAIKENRELDLSWLPMPRWNGFIISAGFQNGVHLLLGRTPDCDNLVPILRIPTDIRVGSVDVGPSLLALRCISGRVLFIHPSISSYFFPSFT